MKNIIKYTMCFGLFLLAFSCQNDDTTQLIADQTNDVRKNQEVDNILAVLMANDWEGNIKTTEANGIYDFYLSFDTEGQMTLTSNTAIVEGKYEMKTSDYGVNVSQYPQLILQTDNLQHYLFIEYETVDFEYRIVSYTPEEIVLSGIVFDQQMVLTPAGSNSLANVQTEYALSEKLMDFPVALGMKYVDEGHIVNFQIDERTRRFYFGNATKGEEDIPIDLLTYYSLDGKFIELNQGASYTIDGVTYEIKRIEIVGDAIITEPTCGIGGSFVIDAKVPQDVVFSTDFVEDFSSQNFQDQPRSVARLVAEFTDADGNEFNPFTAVDGYNQLQMYYKRFSSPSDHAFAVFAPDENDSNRWFRLYMDFEFDDNNNVTFRKNIWRENSYTTQEYMDQIEQIYDDLNFFDVKWNISDVGANSSGEEQFKYTNTETCVSFTMRFPE